MRKLLSLLALAGAFLPAQTMQKLSYPAAPKTAQSDDFHGTAIADPYRTLEDADAAATQQWVEQENALTRGYLDKIPGREAIHDRLTKLWNYEKFGVFLKAGSSYFYSRNSGLQNQSVWYVADSLSGTARELLDPNTYRKDGTAAVSGISPDWSGKLFGYAIAQAGSDWTEWRIRNVSNGKDLSDVISWTKNGRLAWLPDNSGFYYSRYPEPPADKLLTVSAENEKIYFHKLGDAQAKDKMIYERADHPAYSLSGQVTEGGRYLIIDIYPGVPGKSLISFLDLRAPNAAVVDLIATPDHSYDWIGIQGSTLYLQTDEGGARGRVITLDLANPKAPAKVVVSEAPETLESVRMAGGKLLLSYLKDAHSLSRLVTLQGTAGREVALPGLGTANWGAVRQSDTELFYSFASFTVPSTIYRLDLKTGSSSVVRQSKVAFDSAAFETTQLFYNSKDGTRVPMFISHRKGLNLDGNNPTILYAYGGFDIAETPSFSPAIAEWLSMGGVYVLANIRGGSEYGEAWHQAGMREKKQNVFDDFIGAAEFLIARKYTSTPKLCIFGGSNGGLLVGAVLNQRPELFGAAMPAVGVMDMLRFQKFGYGNQWMGEYGNPEVPADFAFIRPYSPLHNIRKGAVYPPTLVTTSDHDDRVMPGHSLKYAATLQQAQEGPGPILIRIETRAGHGAGKPTSKTIDEWADRFAFLTDALHISR